MQVTQQRNQAHIILATHEYNILSWLSKSKASPIPPKSAYLIQSMSCFSALLLSCADHYFSLAGVGQGRFTYEVIGDFTADEGREFFEKFALPTYGYTEELTNEQWSTIYEVRLVCCSVVASSFICLHLCRKLPIQALEESIHMQVTGGNPHLLICAAAQYGVQDRGDWDVGKPSKA